MTDRDIPLSTLLVHLEDLVRNGLALWDLPRDVTPRLINVSENTTWLIENTRGFRAVLRVHREGYHSKRAIACELAWIEALRGADVVPTAKMFTGRNGKVIQQAGTPGLPSARYLVLFEHLPGAAPDQTSDMTAGFSTVGAMAARCHTHVLGWQKPRPFERLVWDEEAVFGSAPTWGNWRDAPGVDEPARQVLEDVERVVCKRLDAYGKTPDRFNLIHADMRLANLLQDAEGTRLIDFDDCGTGWFMYDFAAAISFIEDDPAVPALRRAWLEGYRSVRRLDPHDEAEIDTFIMLRRMALLAWIGSHIEAPEPRTLAPHFARNTVRLGRDWLLRAGA
ncbi:phosphotransferase enzyme family protein [Roseobacter ponti]|uniref:Phosphotransferase n=1 Tax=Roseobacter ponti TaxID=1891787 RepID=A0A858STJ0_9RHOB|nr:phosphotransferase [Roseobacter ponti]QJF51995.1 phosphotransferase [Roseobacter ponti]